MTRDRRTRVLSFALALTFALLVGGCAARPPAFNEDLRARTFDRYWDELEENYPFFDAAGPNRAGVDWTDVRDRYRPSALAAQHPDDFYHVLVGMLSELDDPHVSLSPAERRDDEPLWTSPGLPWRALVDRGWYITGWGDYPAPEPPAAFAGREHVYPRLLRVEGQRPSLTLVDDLLMGRGGTDVEIELQWPDSTVTTHTLRRPVPVALPDTIDGEKVDLIRNPALLREIARLLGPPVYVQRFGDIGYLRVDTFDSDDAVRTQSELTEMLDNAVNEVIDCRGVILDLRNNPGGEARIMSDFVGRFTDRTIPMGEIRLPVLGIFPITFEWEVRPRRPICNARLAILTRPLTGSSAEHAAKLLRERGDCVIIGSRTAGAEAAVESVRGPDGSTLSYGRRRITDAQGRGLQFVGVEPDVRIEMTREMLESMGAPAAGRELQIRRFRAALEALDAESLWPRLSAELRELSSGAGSDASETPEPGAQTPPAPPIPPATPPGP